MAETAREIVILVPGLLCDRVVWSVQIEALSDSFDLRVPQLDSHDSIESMAHTVLGLSDGVFSLVGHSMGGYVALEIMRQEPHRVRRLALMSTQPRADSPEQAARRQNFSAETQRGGFLDVIAGFPALLFHERKLCEPALVETFNAMARRVGKDAFLRQQRAIMGRTDSVATLASISCPTLVLCGRQDLITPRDNSELMAAAIPGASLSILEDCGHMVPLEYPAIVNAALREWMERSQ